MNSFNIIVSKKVEKAFNQAWDLINRLEEEGDDDKLWRSAYKLLDDLPDRSIDLRDHIGFYPPKILKLLKKKGKNEVVFICPDDEDIFLIFGSEQNAIDRINTVKKMLKGMKTRK